MEQMLYVTGTASLAVVFWRFRLAWRQQRRRGRSVSATANVRVRL